MTHSDAAFFIVRLIPDKLTRKKSPSPTLIVVYPYHAQVINLQN